MRPSISSSDNTFIVHLYILKILYIHSVADLTKKNQPQLRNATV